MCILYLSELSCSAILRYLLTKINKNLQNSDTGSDILLYKRHTKHTLCINKP